MKAPDKLYVAESRKIIGDIEHNVFSEQPFLRGSIEYIRKDALLEWAKAKKAELLNEELTDVAAGINMGMDMLIYKLEQL